MTCTNPEKKRMTGEGRGEKVSFSPHPFPPLFVFSSRSTFRAITRLKTLATQASRASSIVAR